LSYCSTLSAEHTSQLIGRLYDCVLDPGLWPETLSAVRSAFRFHNAIIEILDLRTNAPIVVAKSGMEEPWLSRALEYSNSEMVAQWGGPDKLLIAPTDQPLVLSAWHPEGVSNVHRYYRDWARPQGLIDAVTVVLARDRLSVGNLTMGRHESAGPITEDVIHGIQILLPHFQRAIEIARLLEGKSLALQNFRDLLDKLSVSAILVREDLTIAFANGAAERMLRVGSPLGRHGNRLVSFRAETSRAVASAVGSLANSISHSTSVVMPIRGCDGSPYIVRILPLARRSLGDDTTPGAAAAVFVAPPFDGDRPMVLRSIAALYELTAAEARVLTLLMLSKAQAEIAAICGVTRATVKGHVLSIFSKMGVNRQADLVNLVRSFDLPVS
jgi:DNA-binding CsgD family transcriptional regulator